LDAVILSWHAYLKSSWTWSLWWGWCMPYRGPFVAFWAGRRSVQTALPRLGKRPRQRPPRARRPEIRYAACLFRLKCRIDWWRMGTSSTSARRNAWRITRSGTHEREVAVPHLCDIGFRRAHFALLSHISNFLGQIHLRIVYRRESGIILPAYANS
jgi:hypothetical protein